MLKTLDVLEYVLDHGDEPVTPSDISNTTGLNAPTCIRLLDGLLARGYVIKKSRREGYIPGPAVFSLGGMNSFYGQMAQFTHSVLRKASEQIGRRVLICTAAAGHKFIMDQYDVTGKALLQSVQNDFYMTTSGRLLLAYFSDTELSNYIKSNGWPEDDWDKINTLEALQKKLVEIRESDHYCYIDVNRNICLSVPLTLPKCPCFVISSYVLSEDEVSSCLEILKNAAREIFELFYPPNNAAI